MASVIIHKDGVFNVYCTIMDTAVFTNGIKEEDLRVYWFVEHGRNGLRYYDIMLGNAKKNGSSSCPSLEDTLVVNRAGPNEAKLSVPEFIEKFLTIPEDYDSYPLEVPFSLYYEDKIK